MKWDFYFCLDKKCLRKVCHKHPSNASTVEEPMWSRYKDCKDRIHLKGDEEDELTK